VNSPVDIKQTLAIKYRLSKKRMNRYIVISIGRHNNNFLKKTQTKIGFCQN
jgi:hypothetical protein